MPGSRIIKSEGCLEYRAYQQGVGWVGWKLDAMRTRLESWLLFFSLGATCGLVILVARNWVRATSLLPPSHAWYLIMALGVCPYLTFFSLGVNVTVLLGKYCRDHEHDAPTMLSGCTKTDYGTMRGWPKPVSEPSEV